MYGGICHWHALILALPVDKNPLLLVCKLKKQTNQKPKRPNEVRYVFIPFQIYFEFGIIKPIHGSVYPKSRLQKLLLPSYEKVLGYFMSKFILLHLTYLYQSNNTPSENS